MTKVMEKLSVDSLETIRPSLVYIFGNSIGDTFEFKNNMGWLICQIVFKVIELRYISRPFQEVKSISICLY